MCDSNYSIVNGDSTALRNFAAQFPISQKMHIKYSDDIIISLEDTDYVLPSVPLHVIDASRHKPQPSSKLHRHQGRCDRFGFQNYVIYIWSSELYADPIPYIIEVSRRKLSLLSSKLRRHQAYLNDTIIYLDNLKRVIYNRLYVIVFLSYKPQSEWKLSSDVSEEHLYDASDKY
ncbi:hypothetical protein ALC53_04695 [Atta colombica]|uniref:Uncharacterized protein n=1 Tax=Atta colombica TaxID=520822 RepID=A0A195BL97_9HYME|nr:hypothetical protein ALC53_04695 [Atta colombica]